MNVWGLYGRRKTDTAEESIENYRGHLNLDAQNQIKVNESDFMAKIINRGTGAFVRSWFLTGTAIMGCFICYPSLKGQESSAQLNSSSHQTSAVDANGVLHQGSDYPGKPPWLEDAVKTVAPAYPFQERKAHHEGRVVVYLTLDLQTGAVVSTKVTKSSGFKAIDDSGVTAMRQWQWKSKKWKEIKMPLTFRLGNPSGPLLPEATRLPAPTTR